MTLLKSQLKTDGEEYQNNRKQFLKILSEWQTITEAMKQGGSENARERHLSYGKLLVRDRIQKLLDPNTTLLELSPLGAYQVYEDALPAAGIITGIARIQNRDCMVIANDATVKGGTYYPLTVKKHLRALTIALENRLPCIYLVDSGGAFLPKQDEVFPDQDHFGRIFYKQAQLSAAGITQIAIVMGSCTAGGAYVPAMSEHTIMVKEQSTIFLAGPPLVKAATGEVVSAEELGGSLTHCKKSGVADYEAENEESALELARQLIRYVPHPFPPQYAHYPASDPLYDPAEIYGIISQDLRKTFDMREIIARIVDGSEFEEFKALYGKTLVCGFAHIQGYPVGIIANNGILFSESALKGTHFIELCEQQRIPLIFLQNITGFMVGSKYEAEGIAKHGAKMVMAVACAQVPKFTILLGSSYGAGNYAMCGRAYSPRLLLSWPNARIGVMGGESAAKVLVQITKEKKAKQGINLTEEETGTLTRRILAQYETQTSAYYATARLWDDGIIDPIYTRQTLAYGLAIARFTPISSPNYGVFRM